MTLLYTYAFTAPDPDARLSWADLVGVGGAPVRPLPLGDVTAAVSDVPERVFDETALRRRLEDLSWLEATARAHDAVVQALAAHGTVLPLRLATLHRDAGSLRASLAEWPDLPARLGKLTGCQEWAVKIDVLSSPDAVPAASAAEDGRSYLRRRHAQRLGGKAREAAVAELERRLPQELAGVVTSVRALTPQSGALARSRRGVNLVNHAYLVPQRHSEQFHARVEALAAHLPDGVAVEVTGPWAPYNFSAP
ncbi:GvpL/GvpF family gas vesicle protein [Streptacidiphilus monticola]|uniref:GvpL/GvpF family gas vesicle protein n=1 Tax=Streptacidiphilus monticola TaxID=2161674 RepID=A0ABW1G091_9ACTN